VTTHNGTVITGITFVDDRAAARVRQQQARSGTPQVVAADSSLHCAGEWHFVTASSTNTYWKPQAYSLRIYANGNRSADYWNQEFLPCWEATWEGNAYAFLSNATGQFINWYSSPLTADIPSYWSEPDFTTHTKFY
jgi:hypothetical protein